MASPGKSAATFGCSDMQKQQSLSPDHDDLVFLVEERGHTYVRPKRCRYYLPPGQRMRIVRDRSGAPIAVYVRAASPQEALETYISLVMKDEIE